MNLDLITYGNPTLDQVEILQKETFLDPLFSELSEFTFPKNSSEATKEELNQIVEYINTLRGKDEYLNRYKTYDSHLRKYFIDGMVKGGENEEDIKGLLTDLLNDITPLLFKLKFHFQRPRPYQLAEYYKLKLFPYKSSSSNSPSFPSGHAFEGKIITEVIGNRYPLTYAFMQNVFKDICYSRIYMGLHYESDIDVGIFCAERVLANKDFKTKYKL